MKFNKKTLILISIAVILIAAITSTTLAMASDGGKYKEPSTKPSGLPPSAKFNPEDGKYYDSDIVDWDSNSHQYVCKPQLPPANYQPKTVSTISGQEWINDHKNSVNEIDQAIIKYYYALQAYNEKHPELIFSSRWEVGQDGGPLTILTDLGVGKLPELLKSVDYQNPFAVNIMIAIDEICRTLIGNTDPSKEGISAWELALKDKVNNANGILDSVVLTLKENPSNKDELINSKLTEVGIFGLPYVYDEVINKSNDALLKYADKVIPDQKLKEFNITGESKNLDSIKKALASCQDDIMVIQSLSAQ